MREGSIVARSNFIGAMRQMSEWSRGTSLEKNVPGRENSKYKCPEAKEYWPNKKAKDTKVDQARRREEGDKYLNPGLSDYKSMSTMFSLHHYEWGDT